MPPSPHLLVRVNERDSRLRRKPKAPARASLPRWLALLGGHAIPQRALVAKVPCRDPVGYRGRSLVFRLCSDRPITERKCLSHIFDRPTFRYRLLSFNSSQQQEKVRSALFEMSDRTIQVTAAIRLMCLSMKNTSKVMKEQRWCLILRVSMPPPATCIVFLSVLVPVGSLEVTVRRGPGSGKPRP